MVGTLHLGAVKLVVHIKRVHNPLRMVTIVMKETVTLITLSQRREKQPTSKKSSDQTTRKSHPYTLVVRKAEENAERSPEPPYLIAWERKECRRIYGMCSLISARLRAVKVQ